jgi:hypothetical protein
MTHEPTPHGPLDPADTQGPWPWPKSKEKA